MMKRKNNIIVSWKSFNENNDNSDIQLLIDIINTQDDVNKKNYYINLLKNKYNFIYANNNDLFYIDNASVNDIKSETDFTTFTNYKKYAEKLLRIREKNIDYSKFYNYKPTSINKDELVVLLEKYNIKSIFKEKGHISRPVDKKNMTIEWAGTDLDKSHVLHEIAHFFDDDIHIPITYALTDYSLTNVSECTCDSIMLYLLNPLYYTEIIPDKATYIKTNIPKWFIELSKELLYEKIIEQSIQIKEITLDEAVKLSQYDDIKSISEWLNKPLDKIKFYYKDEPITLFKQTILEMESTFDEFPEEENRVYKIYDILKKGGNKMPIFIELNDPDYFILEGRHRIVAFKWMDYDNVPVIYVK